MQHISSNITPQIKQSRGGRISSSRHREAIELCDDFTGLEEDTGRYDLLLLVKRVGKGAGFSPRMIELLDYYMAFTRDIDWEEGARPIVYQSLSKTALDLGVSERQIQKLEKLLFEIGAITWNDSGNHRRYGQRCNETGAILYAFGVDLTPLAYLKGELQTKLDENRLYKDAWMGTKRQISWYRRQIRAILLEEEEALEQDRGLLPTSLRIEADAKYEDISFQIRTHINLETLRTLLSSHKELHEGLLSQIRTSEAAQRDPGRPSNESKETSKSSSKSEQAFTYYKYTNHKQSDKSDTSRPPANCFQESVPERLSSQSGTVPDEPKERAGGRPKTIKAKDVPGKVEKGPEELILATGLQHITLKQALNAASSRFRDYLPLEPRPLNWSDMVDTAYKLRPDLHISQKSWVEACTLLGRIGATICLLLTDQATQRDKNPVTKPGAYFYAMLNKAKSGELRLNSSIFGILKKDEE
ncbi:MAG: hypothetical protein GY797_01205 [Deltaproteobacteria bacterium]|nr:hypothetical protein [Deltaproteobacteria bacterium]